jgi:hypothetical protein
MIIRKDIFTLQLCAQKHSVVCSVALIDDVP